MRCYYNQNKTDLQGNSLQCTNEQNDCWCSEEHKIKWQQENYKEKPKTKFEDFLKRGKK